MLHKLILQNAGQMQLHKFYNGLNYHFNFVVDCCKYAKSPVDESALSLSVCEREIMDTILQGEVLA